MAPPGAGAGTFKRSPGPRQLAFLFIAAIVLMTCSCTSGSGALDLKPYQASAASDSIDDPAAAQHLVDGMPQDPGSSYDADSKRVIERRTATLRDRWEWAANLYDDEKHDDVAEPDAESPPPYASKSAAPVATEPGAPRSRRLHGLLLKKGDVAAASTDAAAAVSHDTVTVNSDVKEPSPSTSRDLAAAASESDPPTLAVTGLLQVTAPGEIERAARAAQV